MSYKKDKQGYVCFREVSLKEFGVDMEYMLCYVDGSDPEECHNLGEGLRFKGLYDRINVSIHIDDIPKLTKRYQPYMVD